MRCAPTRSLSCFPKAPSRRPGQAGRPRDRGQIWWRSLCGLAQRRRWHGSDLYRSPAGDVRDDRKRPRTVNAMIDTFLNPASPDAGSGLSVRNATVTYRNGHTALRDATFKIPAGTITALVGRERQRQVHAVQGDHGVRPARRGRDHDPRPAGQRRAEEEHRRLCAAERGDRLELPGPGRGRGDDGPLWPHEHDAHRQGRGSRSRRTRRSPASA